MFLSPSYRSGVRLITWLEQEHGGAISEAIRVDASRACQGSGVFATQRRLAPFEPIATIPLSACITAQDACSDREIGRSVVEYLREHSEMLGANAVGVASLLAHARFGTSSAAHNAKARWRPYLDSLPWDAPLPPVAITPPQDDALGALVATEYADQVSELDRLATAVHEVLGRRIDKAFCRQAFQLAASRCFSLAPFIRSDGRHRKIAPSTADGVLVPFLDVFNHPSRRALAQTRIGSKFARTPLREIVCRWAYEDVVSAVRVYAPGEPPALGDELYNMYDLAGADEVFRPNSDFLGLQTERLLAATWSDARLREWAEGEAFFRARFGFSPWD